MDLVVSERFLVVSNGFTVREYNVALDDDYV